MYGLRRIPYNHAIWHLFVLSGSAGFFVGVYWFL
jgi:hemolysin III